MVRICFVSDDDDDDGETSAQTYDRRKKKKIQINRGPPQKKTAQSTSETINRSLKP